MAQNEDRYYQCPMCWKAFTKPHTVKIHMRVHTGERPYQCLYCPKSFTTSGNLGDHLRVHSTARMFKCKLCGTKFKRKATLKRHYEMHAKFKRDRKLKDNVDILVSENAEELLQTEIINHPSCFSSYEENQRLQESTDVVVAENNEEILQAEISNSDSQLGDFQENRATSIELLLPPENEEEGQEKIVVIPPLVKEEKLDDFYDATILELTEELEDLGGVQVSVYSLPGTSTSSAKGSIQHYGGEKPINLFKLTEENSKSVGLANYSSTFKKPLDSNTLTSDMSKRYGVYITKMIKMIQSKEEQAKLIKELNQVIHEYVIANR